jgi:predicted kinase
MKKAIIIIGQTAGGKTTYIKKQFLSNIKDINYLDKPIKRTEGLLGTDKILMFGHHKGEKRCEGSDELSMSILPQLIEYINKEKGNFDILIAEGDRINNQRFFDFVKSLNIIIELKYFCCSIQESMQRRLETGSNPNETFVKTTRTKSERMKLYAKELGFNVEEINTGKIKEEQQKTLF